MAMESLAGAAHFQQQAIQIITNILLGHCKAGAVEHAFKRLPSHLDFEGAFGFLNCRKITGWQCGKTEAATTNPDNRFAILG